MTGKSPMTRAPASEREAALRLCFTPEEIEAALAELGSPGSRAEAIVTTAAIAAVHVLRGGTIARANRALERAAAASMAADIRGEYEG